MLHLQEEEEEEENRLAEEAEQRVSELRTIDHNDPTASQPATVEQPETSGAAFVNISFELEPVPTVSAPDRVPPHLPSWKLSQTFLTCCKTLNSLSKFS